AHRPRRSARTQRQLLRSRRGTDCWRRRGIVREHLTVRLKPAAQARVQGLTALLALRASIQVGLKAALVLLACTFYNLPPLLAAHSSPLLIAISCQRTTGRCAFDHHATNETHCARRIVNGACRAGLRTTNARSARLAGPWQIGVPACCAERATAD